ncbi:hypothetical protein BDP27DRAFT_213447 [Rhodocollybia butyracea]|uniref:Uncharacterized protein n=1 Tax=Rhodocollybia butyracea TaxID=206335 RepID=A0A9P5U2S4_9AGAR|nr:hypothetical protein BDP27DRAFT_213447 [Rhodocollybia butyracea]
MLYVVRRYLLWTRNVVLLTRVPFMFPLLLVPTSILIILSLLSPWFPSHVVPTKQSNTLAERLIEKRNSKDGALILAIPERQLPSVTCNGELGLQGLGVSDGSG